LYCLFRAPAILLSSLFFPSSATSEIYTLSLHDALPIYEVLRRKARQGVEVRILYDDLGSIITLPNNFMAQLKNEGIQALAFNPVDRKSTRLNSSHVKISYAVFCLKKKKKIRDSIYNSL